MRKKNIYLAIVLVICSYFQGFSQFEGAKQTFSAPNIKEEIGKHKIVAILPFDVVITYKRTPPSWRVSSPDFS